MKVLIISHNPMSHKHSIGKTLLSLFSEFKKEELCQLYIHTGIPDSDVCSSFFQVTDKDVLKGFCTRNVHGKVVSAVAEEDVSENALTGLYEKLYSSSKKRNPDRELLRDLMWKFSPWYNKKMKLWIEEQKPTCIFVAIGSGKFLYEMAIRISLDYSIPLFTYVCDDFYSMEAPSTISGRLWKKMLILKTKELMDKTSVIVSICDELSDYYSKEFQLPAVTIMTGTNYTIATQTRNQNEVSTLRYFGKLSLNRYKSMADLCRVIDEINFKSGKSYSVEIYCGGVDDEIRDAFEGIASAKFFDFISGQIFKDTFLKTDVLIHVEAFDAESIDRVKYSVSTKIADSLASGIPLVAYAPENVASMQHLLRNQCAFAATSKSELREQLDLLFASQERRIEISENAIKTAGKYHNPKNVSQQLHKILLNEGNV